MSTRVTSAITSRQAREKLIRLLFPKKDATVAGGTLSSSPSSLQAHETDRHNHKGRRTRGSTHNPSDASYSSSTTDVAAENNQKKRHSYSQLRTVYLQRVHAMHPDKMAHQKQQSSTVQEDEGTADTNQGRNNTNATKEDAHMQFIELKNAWEEYHASVRIVHKGSNGRGSSNNASNNNNYSKEDNSFWEVEEEGEDDFTMFGVGCSFADSPEERDRRNEIMEQACRGWFSSGALSDRDPALGWGGGKAKSTTATKSASSEDGVTSTIQQSSVKLSDDDLFIACSANDKVDDDTLSSYAKQDDFPKRKSLIPNLGQTTLRRKR